MSVATSTCTPTRRERGEVALAGVLRQVAVQLDARASPAAVSCLASFLAGVLGAGEQQAAARRPTASSRTTAGLSVEPTANTWCAIAATGASTESTECVTGFAQVALDEHVDAVVERGREQQPLRARRGLVEQPLDAGQEAEVGHVVGLVEHRDLDGVEAAVPLADQVLEPAGAGDDDVDAGRGARRPGGPGATPPKTVVIAHARAQRPAAAMRLGHLVGELAGRHEHQRPRTAALRGAGAGRWRRGARPSAGAKAIVLPLPVRPRPRTSRPARESGRVAAWIGKAMLIPCAARTSTSGAATPSDAKSTGVYGTAGAVAGAAAARAGAAGAGVLREPRRSREPEDEVDVRERSGPCWDKMCSSGRAMSPPERAAAPQWGRPSDADLPVARRARRLRQVERVMFGDDALEHRTTAPSLTVPSRSLCPTRFQIPASAKRT